MGLVLLVLVFVWGFVINTAPLGTFMRALLCTFLFEGKNILSLSCCWCCMSGRSGDSSVSAYDQKHVCVCTQAYAPIIASLYSCMHTCVHTCIHTYMHACMHIYMHICIHTYIHTHAYISMLHGLSCDGSCFYAATCMQN